MQFKIYPDKANISSQDLLDLSRTIRQCREETEDVRRQLQQLSGLEECRTALLRQEEGLAQLTARSVGMSSALREISEVYSTAETRNVDALEAKPRSLKEPEHVISYSVLHDMHRRIQNILY